MCARIARLDLKFRRLVVVMSCMAFSNVFAQTEASPQMETKNSLFKGSWSVQFRITNDFVLSDFQGGTLSAKRHFSDKKAVRFGLSLSGNTGDSEERSVLGPMIDGTGNGLSVGLSLQYLVYPSPQKSVMAFFGAGPYFNFSRSNQTSTKQTVPSSRTKWENSVWSAGISGLLGVEWFVSRSLSFIAEYASSLGYNSASVEEMNEVQAPSGDFARANESRRDASVFRLGSESVKFGLSVYF
jgi:hypothetical protein